MTTTTTSKSATRAARAAGSADHANRSAGRSAAMTIVVTGLLVIVALYFIVPVYWVFVAASKTTEDLFSSFGFWFAPNFALWENLSQVVTYDNGIFVRWFLNSVLYAGVGALLATYLAAADFPFTLLAAGENSTVPAHEEALIRARHPAAEIRRFAGTGHFLPVTHPQLVRPYLEAMA